MNREVDINTTTIMQTGPLPKSGGDYSLVLLSVAHIEQILLLEKEVINALSQEERSYLLEKDKYFFEQHFANGNLVLGVVHDGVLVAQSVVVNPTPTNPKNGMVDMPLKAKPEEVTVLQGVIVDSAYRGNALMTKMVDVWLDVADKNGRIHALAEVAVGNKYSWAVFMKEGLRIHSMGCDPSDGTEVYNIHADVKVLIQERLSPAFNKVAGVKEISCARKNIAAQKALLAQDYEGVEYDAKNDNIVFAPVNKATCGL